MRTEYFARKICLSLVAAALPVVPALSATVPANLLVVPGHSVGKITIGMPEAELKALLGKPVRQEKNEWVEYISKEQTLDVYLDKGKVSEISFTSPKFRTADGLSTANNDNARYLKKFECSKLKWLFMNLRRQLKTGGLTFYTLNDESDNPEHPRTAMGMVYAGAKPLHPALELDGEPNGGWQAWNGNYNSLWTDVKALGPGTVGQSAR